MPRKPSARRQEALAQLDAHHAAAIVESTDDAVIGKTLDGTIVSWNPAAERMYGYTAEEAIGRSITMLEPAERAGEIKRILQKIRAGERVEHHETVRICKDGDRLEVSLTVSPLRDPEGRVIGASAIGRDITKQRDLARTVERTSLELRQANERLREFMAVASHDLQSPLASVLGFATTLRERWDDIPDERKREFIGVIESQGRHMSRLVDDLLMESKIEARALDTRTVEVDVRDAVARALAHPELADAEVKTEIQADLRALVDPYHLDRILANLLGNATRYALPPLQVLADRVGKMVEIRVCDAGPGIPSEFVPRLFDRFTRAATDQAGTGLGLSIVRGLAEANDGGVRFEPVPDGGSMFAVRLPAVRP